MRVVIIMGLCLVMGLDMMAQKEGVLTGRDAKAFLVDSCIKELIIEVIQKGVGPFRSIWINETVIIQNPGNWLKNSSGRGRRVVEGNVVYYNWWIKNGIYKERVSFEILEDRNRTFRDSLHQ